MGKIMYLDDEFQGRIVVNGGSPQPVPVEQKLIGSLYSLSSEARMGVTGEMPVLLSMSKSGGGFEPYEEFLERQAKMKGEEK